MTHTDGDHIGGIKPLLTDFGNNWFLQSWFNHAPQPYRLPSDSGESSIRQGIALRDFLLSRTKVNKEPILTGYTYQVGEATLTVLSPDRDQFDELLDEWKAEEIIQPSMDNPSSAVLSDHRETIESLIAKSYSPDKSLSNRSSIAFLFTLGTITAMFTGDAHAEVISKAIRDLGYTPNHPLQLQCMKLSHHGSRSNTSRELMELLDCQHYLISTNAGNRHQFPHKEALARVIEATHRRRPEQSIHFYFTYNDSALRDLFSSKERDTYNLICHYPQNGTSSIILSF